MGSLKGRSRRMVVPAWMLVLVVVVVSMQSVSAILHKIGGNRYNGWKEYYNYTQWSMNEHFVVGDWLYFGYERSLYNVLQVNQAAYDNCISQNPIKNVTGGAGRDVFQMVQPVTYYFISGVGASCVHGMKVAIPTVVNTTVV